MTVAAATRKGCRGRAIHRLKFSPDQAVSSPSQLCHSPQLVRTRIYSSLVLRAVAIASQIYTPSMDHHVVVQLAQHRYSGSPSADQPPAAAASGESTPRMEMCPSLYRAARSGRSEEVVALLLQQRHGAGSAAGHRHQVAGNLIN